LPSLVTSALKDYTEAWKEAEGTPLLGR